MYNVEVNGIQLAVNEQGSGEAVVFVPGGLSDYRSWQPQVELFSAKYHAIAYSRRYQYPHRPVPGGTSTVAENASDLTALIDRLGVAPVHVVAHSYGAFAALLCARDHPELFKTLVLGEPPAMPLLVKDPNNPATILPLLMRDPAAAISLLKFGISAVKPAQKAFGRGDTASAAQAFIRGITGRAIVIDELPPMIRETMRANGEAMRHELDVSVPFTSADAARVRVPTLLVRGDQSPKFLLAIMDRLAQSMPDSEELVLHGASHFLHWEKPVEFNAGVQAFLAKHASNGMAESSDKMKTIASGQSSL